jgi:hypothetical protein
MFHRAKHFSLLQTITPNHRLLSFPCRLKSHFDRRIGQTFWNPPAELEVYLY